MSDQATITSSLDPSIMVVGGTENLLNSGSLVVNAMLVGWGMTAIFAIVVSRFCWVMYRDHKEINLKTVDAIHNLNNLIRDRL